MRGLRFLVTSVTIAICLVLVLASSAIPILAADNVTVAVNTPVEVASGDTITMYLDITEVTDLSEATVTVLYDENVLQFVDCSNGNLNGDSLVVTYTSSAGRIDANITGGSNPGSSGTGYLMDLKFCVIGKPCQSSCIDIEGELFDSNSNPITTDWVDGWVCVPNPRTVETLNSASAKESVFHLNEDVYIKGSGFTGNTYYDVWVVPYEECTYVKEGDNLNDLGGPGKVTTIKTDALGKISPMNIGPVPVNDPTTYWEIVVDDGNGIFNGAEDGLIACCCGERGFNIYPELPTTVLFGIGLVGLASVSGLVVLRRRPTYHRVDPIT